MKKKLIKLIIVVAILGAVAYWYYYKYLPGTLPGGDVVAISDADQQTYDAMVAVFSANANPDALPWLLSDMKKAADAGTIEQQYFIGNQLPKSALFLHVYGTEYYGYGYVYKDRTAPLAVTAPGSPTTEAEEYTNKSLYDLFFKYRAKYIINA